METVGCWPGLARTSVDPWWAAAVGPCLQSWGQRRPLLSALPGPCSPMSTPTPAGCVEPAHAAPVVWGLFGGALSLCCVLAFSCGCTGALLEAAVPQGWVWGHLREGLFQHLDKEA